MQKYPKHVGMNSYSPCFGDFYLILFFILKHWNDRLRIILSSLSVCQENVLCKSNNQ